MLNSKEVSRAVEMQRHSYHLLQWMAKAVGEGFIQFQTAHNYSSLPEAAQEWVLRHYLNIPANARAAREDVPDFCRFFSTYLETSFELIEDPGQHMYSPHAHCFCPMCSWLVKAPHLKTKKLVPADKKRARKMMAGAVRHIAAEKRVDLTDGQADAIVEELREDCALLAYAYELLKRMKGISSGPAVLALWREFAWLKTGSPKHGYKLTAKAILASEQRLSDAVDAHSSKNE
jgi:hypothetical protein